MAKKTTIRCPYCNTEYLPGEIYVPEDFVGQPTAIVKDENGDVLGFDGEDMNTVETYYCDKCGHQFKIDASITFRTEKIEDVFEDDFDVDTDKESK